MRPIDPPSMAIQLSIFGPPSLKRCFTPLRSPKPSSPTEPIKSIFSFGLIPVAYIVSIRVNIIDKPLVSSPIPGAKRVSFLIFTFTSVPSGKTVSK